MNAPDRREPKPEDFGIKPEDYAVYRQKAVIIHTYHSCLAGLASYALLVLFAYLLLGEMWYLAVVVVLPLLIIVPNLTENHSFSIEKHISRFRRRRVFENSLVTTIEQYDEALVAYREEERQRLEKERQAQEALERALLEEWREAERIRQETIRKQKEAERARRRKLADYWISLDGLEFEVEMATLCETLGYQVQSTPISGDQGIDLILKRGGKTTIVQCKAHKAAAGPSIVREIFGTMIAFGADSAIVACTGGFTRGAEDFAQGRPITLLSARELVRLSENPGWETIETVKRLPTCPDCSRTMVLRKPYYGRKFWGCPAYPNCLGRRNIQEALWDWD